MFNLRWLRLIMFLFAPSLANASDLAATDEWAHGVNMCETSAFEHDLDVALDADFPSLLQLDHVEHGRDAKALFCFAVQGPGDDEIIRLAREQMKKCDGFLVFSNYSDPVMQTIKLFEGDMLTNIVGGWANLTFMFKDVWQYLAESSIPDEYGWLAKIDPDTYLRPETLLRYHLSPLDPDEPLGLMMGDLGFKGALEVVSYKVLRHDNTQDFINFDSDYSPCEDVWLTGAFHHSRFRAIEKPLMGYIWNYKQEAATERLLPTNGLSPDILVIQPTLAAVHPVKDVDLYDAFSKRD